MAIFSVAGANGVDVGVECDKCGRQEGGFYLPYVEYYKPTGFSFWRRLLATVGEIRDLACQDGWEISWWWDGNLIARSDLCPACSPPWTLGDVEPKFPLRKRR